MNQKRKLSTFLRKMTVLASLLVVGVLTFSCGSDDGAVTPGPGGEGKNIKLTITINGVVPDDYLSFVTVGSALNDPMQSTIWKVNGVTQTNETSVSLNKDSFTGSTKTYVIESATPLRMAIVGMEFLAFGTRSYTFSYKAEVNGQVVKEENNVTVSEGNNYSHDYTY